MAVASDMQGQTEELLRTEAALREREQHLRFLSENLADGMVYQIDSGPDGQQRRFSYIAPAVERFHGVQVEDVLRDPGLIYGQVVEEDLALVQAREAEATATHTPMDVEVRVRLPSGEVRWRHFRSAPRRHANGNLVWDGIELDVTDRRRAEDERERLRSQLAQAQRIEAIGRLAGGVAHDVNNSLQVICGHAELALHAPDLPAAVRADIEQIRKAAAHSADLTRQLLAFARRQAAVPQVLDLNAAIGDLIGMLRRLVGEQIDVVVLPGAGLWRVRMDPAQLGEILANLCVNARDAIGRSGRITISTENRRLDTAACAGTPGLVPGEYVQIELSDDGCGMAKDVLEHIFEPFFTTKGALGTGLGLATVHGIVSQNDGKIEATSAPGRGTTFRICLPRAGAPVPAASSSAAARGSSRPHGAETVLLVEDDDAPRLACRRMLEALGYTVLAASDGAAALELARQHPGSVHLLLSDVVMPGMQGPELAERLSALRPGLRCLFMSGYNDEVISHHGILNPGVRFISKPFSMDEIAAKLREALS